MPINIIPKEQVTEEKEKGKKEKEKKEKEKPTRKVLIIPKEQVTEEKEKGKKEKGKKEKEKKEKEKKEKEKPVKKVPIIPKERVLEEKEELIKKVPTRKLPPSCPRLTVPVRKKPLEVKTIIPAEDACCTDICQTLNSEIDRYSSIIAKLERDIERGCVLPGIDKAISAIAYKMNSLEDYRSFIKKRNICKCIE